MVTGVGGGGAGGANAPPKVWFGENPGKIWKFGQNVWKPSQNYCMWFEFIKMAPKVKVRMLFFWRSCFLSKFGWNLGKNGAWSSLIWINAPDMKWNAVVFLEVIIFGQVWGNLGKNPSHPLKFTCSCTYWQWLTTNVQKP